MKHLLPFFLRPPALYITAHISYWTGSFREGSLDSMTGLAHWSNVLWEQGLFCLGHHPENGTQNCVNYTTALNEYCCTVQYRGEEGQNIATHIIHSSIRFYWASLCISPEWQTWEPGVDRTWMPRPSRQWGGGWTSGRAKGDLKDAPDQAKL